MIRVAVCDDEPRILESLASMIRLEIEPVQIDTFTDGNQLLKAQELQPYDIALLDIEMPAISGMEMAERLRDEKRNLILIFVTDFSEMVYRSFVYAPFRFIRKGCIDQELPEALHAAARIVRERKRSYTIVEKGVQKLLPLNEIQYIEVEGHKADIYTNQGVCSIRKSIRELTEELSEYDFVKTHASYLVNMEYINGLEWDKVILQDGTNVPMSRGKKADVRERFAEYLGRHN